MKRLIEDESARRGPLGPLRELVEAAPPLPHLDDAMTRVAARLEAPARLRSMPHLALRLAAIAVVLLAGSAMASAIGRHWIAARFRTPSPSMSPSGVPTLRRAAPPPVVAPPATHREPQPPALPGPAAASSPAPSSARSSTAPIVPPMALSSGHLIAPSLARSITPSARPSSNPTSPVDPSAPSARSAVADKEAELVLRGTRLLRVEGDAARASIVLAEYLRRFPRGMLEEEALALAIEAADGRDPVSAAALSRRYLARFPEGSYAEFARDVAIRAAR